MTVVIGVAAPDGMILAADSRTTFTDGAHHRIATDYAQKVFAICGSIGVATYGDAFVGSRTIAGLMDEFVSQRAEEGDVDAEAIANELGAFFDGRFRNDSTPEYVELCEGNGLFPLGFLVAGYDSDGIGRIREVSVPGPLVQHENLIDTASVGVAWRGQTDVIRRLLKGFDHDLFFALGNALPEELKDPIAALEYQLIFPVTMQDGVDLASFLIRTTIDMQRFSNGTIGQPGDLPGCGGPERILAVTREGPLWVVAPTLTGATGAGVAEGGVAPAT